jgi:hypothetical protein
MGMNIQVEIKNVYGVRSVYPVSDTAKLLARLAGTKTFTPSAIETIKQLGYTVSVVQPVVSL